MAEKNFLTPEQCAKQFELYAECHTDPDSIRQLKFCAEFLREFCIQIPLPENNKHE